MQDYCHICKQPVGLCPRMLRDYDRYFDTQQAANKTLLPYEEWVKIKVD